MATRRTEQTTASDAGKGGAVPPGTSILILEARFYQDISDALAAGAIAELDARGARWERLAVPGALELPFALKEAAVAGLIPATAPRARWHGVVALGCVIRGETAHFDIVCQNANHWLMNTALAYNIPLGNGILTVDHEAQALARTRGGRHGKGGDAARACLALVALARSFQESPL